MIHDLLLALLPIFCGIGLAVYIAKRGNAKLTTHRRMAP